MSPSTKHFLRHYGEMVLAMFLGMAVLGLPADWAMRSVGADADAWMFVEMATTMTVPMVGWMAYRGHGTRANAEMSASMFVPTFAVIGLLGVELVTDIGTLLVIEHVAMLAGMLVAMLLRASEYTGHHAHRAAPQRVTA